jgi:hypothetical protein
MLILRRIDSKISFVIERWMALLLIQDFAVVSRREVDDDGENPVLFPQDIPMLLWHNPRQLKILLGSNDEYVLLNLLSEHTSNQPENTPVDYTDRFDDEDARKVIRLGLGTLGECLLDDTYPPPLAVSWHLASILRRDEGDLAEGSGNDGRGLPFPVIGIGEEFDYR